MSKNSDPAGYIPPYNQMQRSAAKNAGYLAFNYDGAKINYRNLSRFIDLAARAMRELHLQPGDHIAIICPSMPETCCLIYGAWQVGVMVDFYPTEYRKADYQRLISSTNPPKIIFIVETAWSKLRLLRRPKDIAIVVISPSDSKPIYKRPSARLASRIIHPLGKPLKAERVYNFDTFTDLGRDNFEELSLSVKPEVIAARFADGSTITNQELFNEVQRSIKDKPEIYQPQKSAFVTVPFSIRAGLVALHRDMCCGMCTILRSSKSNNSTRHVLDKFHPDIVVK